MKIKDLLQRSKSKLYNFSPTPDLDVEILLSSILNKDREFLFSHSDYEISPKKITGFEALIQKRVRQEPIAYLIKEKSFYGRPFNVTPDTLIPRPETELLIEKTLEYCHKQFYPSKNIALVDIGTGSGCILISLLKELQKSHFKDSQIKAFGTDISSKALKIAQKNAQNLKVNWKINFLKGELLKPLLSNLSSDKFNHNAQLIITANLPYLSPKIYQNCPPSVLDFESKKALFAKKDGLEFYLKLLNQIKDSKLLDLVQNLYLIFEISPEQKELVQTKFEKILPQAKLKFGKDLAQKWRFIEIFF